MSSIYEFSDEDLPSDGWNPGDIRIVNTPSFPPHIAYNGSENIVYRPAWNPTFYTDPKRLKEIESLLSCEDDI